MNTVTPGLAADNDDKVAGLLLSPLAQTYRHEPYRAAKYQGIADIALIEENSAVGRGNTHAVTVIGDTGTDTFENTARM